MFHRIILILLAVSAATAALAQTAPSALTTAAGPPVAVPKKQKGAFFKRIAEQAGVPKAIVNDPLSTTAYGLPNVSKTDSAGGLFSDMLSSTIPDLGLKIKSFKKEKGSKREKKKVSKTDYEGLPMIRQFIKTGSGDRTIVQEFHVLKTWQTPSVYVRELSGYSQKEGRIKAITKDMDGVYLMHGPYKRYQNGELVEEGFYYLGARDGRWEKYGAKFMLTDKARYYRGFPADAQIAYYDSAHTQIKQVMPYEYGQLRGTYLAYHTNGELTEEGKYDNGVKVGRWTEYYPKTGTHRFRRRVTQYARDRWDIDAEPTVISEWDEKGKITYERQKEKKGSEEEEEEPDAQ